MKRPKVSPTFSWLAVLSLTLTLATSTLVGSGAAKSMSNATSGSAQKSTYSQRLERTHSRIILEDGALKHQDCFEWTCSTYC